MEAFTNGSQVYWKWMGRTMEGTVEEVHLSPVSKTIKGKKIKRNGSPAKPAYLVKSTAGNLALKLHTELEQASIERRKYQGPKPTLFGDD